MFRTLFRTPTTRARTRMSLLLGGLAAVLVAAGFTVPGAHADEFTTTKYKPLRGPVANPERGWSDGVDLLHERDLSWLPDDGTTLVHAYARLDQYVDSALPPRVLNRLRLGLRAVRAERRKVILRFTYNLGPGADASRARILQHIERLGPVLRRHAEVIAAIQAGFVGYWGEWHHSTHGLDESLTSKRRILRAERAAFPGQLMLRYPRDVHDLGAYQSSRTVGGTSLTDSVGVHQDCFLASDPDDFGTWGVYGSTVRADKALVARVGRYAVVGGETCAVSSRTTCDTALDEMSRMHFTYLNRNYEPSALARLSKCKNEIGKRMGYRLRLKRASWPTALTPESTQLDLKPFVRNAGYASPYSERPVFAVLTCNRESQWIPLDADPRAWDPGALIKVEQRLEIAPPGAAKSCRLGIAMPDGHEELRDLPAYSIRFASDMPWVKGVNVLGRIPVDH